VAACVQDRVVSPERSRDDDERGVTSIERDRAIALVDVHYEGDGARAACVTAVNWDDARALDEWTVEVPEVAQYRPGFFFERELPCILAVLERAPAEPRGVVIDG